MATLEQIEKEVAQLPTPEKRALLEWLEDLLERASRDIAQSRGRIVKP